MRCRRTCVPNDKTKLKGYIFIKLLERKYVVISINVSSQQNLA